MIPLKLEQDLIIKHNPDTNTIYAHSDRAFKIKDNIKDLIQHKTIDKLNALGFSLEGSNIIYFFRASYLAEFLDNINDSIIPNATASNKKRFQELIESNKVNKQSYIIPYAMIENKFLAKIGDKNEFHFWGGVHNIPEFGLSIAIKKFNETGYKFYEGDKNILALEPITINGIEYRFYLTLYQNTFDVRNDKIKTKWVTREEFIENTQLSFKQFMQSNNKINILATRNPDNNKINFTELVQSILD